MVLMNLTAGQEQRHRRRERTCGHRRRSCQSAPKHVQLFSNPWTAACQASLSFTVSWSLLKLMSIESVMPSNHLILCHPFLFQPSIFPSTGVFSNESVLHIRGPNHWSFFISPSNEYSVLISFRIDWFDVLAVQGTLNSLLQLHNLKASIIQWSALFMVQLSHLYMTTEKIIALIIQTFVSRVMSLIFKKLSIFIIFSSKEQTSFNFAATVTVCRNFGAQENKIQHCFHFSPINLP